MPHFLSLLTVAYRGYLSPQNPTRTKLLSMPLCITLAAVIKANSLILCTIIHLDIASTPQSMTEKQSFWHLLLLQGHVSACPKSLFFRLYFLCSIEAATYSNKIKFYY